MQIKLDQEKVARQSAENAKLEMEKKKNELLVDLDQIRSQSSKLAQDLRCTYLYVHDIYSPVYILIYSLLLVLIYSLVLKRKISCS